MYEFGRCLGMAFQLQDDLLDVYGSPEIFGKEIGGDIVSNKKTYLLLKALELADYQTRKSLENWFFNKSDTKVEGKPDHHKKIVNVIACYDKLNIKEQALIQINHYAEKAFSHLDSIQIENKRKLQLTTYCMGLYQREF